MIPEPEDTFSMRSSHVALDQVEIAFDDQQAVASAGLLLPATLAERLGIEQATDQLVDLGDRPGRPVPGASCSPLVHALVAGGDCIDDVELLRCRGDRERARPPGDGRLHGRDVPAGVYVRARPPARPADRDDPWAGVGGGRRTRGTGRLWWMWTPPSARSTATTSRAPATATPTGSATTRCWPPAPTPARCCTPGCARARPTPPAASCGSLMSWWPGCVAPAPAAS